MSKKFVRSMVSLLLVFACMLSVAPIASAAASDDYTKWKQYDSAWNRQEAWPYNEYPNASMRYMKQAGCAVTSVAMLLRHYNVITDSNVNNFNPWVCNENLKNVGAFTSAADLRWADVSNAYPGFEYAGQTTSFSQSKLYDLYSQGYACLVNVNYKGSGHYVAVQSATSSGATIMDPGSSATSLSSYGTKYKIVYFTANPDSSQSFGTYATISDSNSPNTLKVGQPYVSVKFPRTLPELRGNEKIQ